MHVIIDNAKIWRRLGLAAASAVLALAVAAAGFSQSSGQNQQPRASDNDITRGELTNFDRFLDSHPEIRRDLMKNPSLINNKEFEEKHPGLRDFLKDHPGVREEIREHPQQFMNRERQFESRGGDITRGELDKFDGFLDSHPEVRKDLMKDPSLVDNKEYLENHPGLRDFIKDHPGVREELKENPKGFMRRERQFEHHERGEHPGRRDRDRDRDPG